MKKTRALVGPLLMAAILISSQPARGGFFELEPPIKPRAGDWALGLGAYYGQFDFAFGRARFTSAHIGGGLVAAEHHFLAGLSLELAVSVTPSVGTTTRTEDLFLLGDEFRATAEIQAIQTVLTAKFYPLRVFGLEKFRLQPYAQAGTGLFLLPISMDATYISPPDSAFIRLELTEAMGMWRIGGGMDFFLTKRLALFAGADYFSTFAEPRLRIALSQPDTDRREQIKMDGFMVRTGLKWVF